MKKAHVALIAAIGAVVLAAGAVATFTVVNNLQANRSQLDKSMAASVRTQIEKPLSLVKGEVKNLKKTSDDPTHLSVQWDAVPDAVGYNVYFSDRDKSKSFTLLEEVTDTTYDIPNLEENGSYWVKVAAKIREGLSVNECPATLLKTVSRVSNVTGLRATHSSEVLGFAWDANPKYDGYEIYRSYEGNSYQFELYQTIDNSKPSFDDEDVESGVLYTYKICPFRSGNGEVCRADGVTIDLISGLNSPAGLVGRAANSRIVLYWQDRELAQGYDVYMSKEDAELELVDTVEGTNYSTDKLEAGANYNFRIVPFRDVDDKRVYGTVSTCTIKATSAGEGSSGSPKSTIVGAGTYIEISISQQHMWFYENGNLVLDTPVVTGNDDGEHDTTKGSFSIQDRGENVTLVGEDYQTPVTYWMGFNGGIGIHDASWRDDFGGDIYQGNGSHGCVNTPYDKVEIIYNHTDYGTPVYVY